MSECEISWRTEPGQARDLIEQWIYTPELRELVEADGGTWPTGTLEEVVQALADWSTVWDFRGGQSRLIFKDGDESRTDERAERVYRACRKLGLIDSEPPTMTEPDYLLILGGLATGVEPRVRYAAELVGSGQVKPTTIVALGSFRQIDERERPIANEYAPAARYEIDLLSGMIGQVLGLVAWQDRMTGDPESDPARAQLIRQADGSDIPIKAYASASSAPEMRPANTADTYAAFLEDVSPRPHSELLIVTSSIYRPYQHLDALRAFGRTSRYTIETVGVPPIRPLGQETMHPPSHYLQEVRSFLRSADRQNR